LRNQNQTIDHEGTKDKKKSGSESCGFQMPYGIRSAIAQSVYWQIILLVFVIFVPSW